MHTNSFILGKIIALLGWLNGLFEHSLLYRGLCYVKRATRSSVAVRSFFDARDYWGGSLIGRALAFLAGMGAKVLAWCAAKLAWMCASSVVLRVVRGAVSSKAVTGCVPWRVGAWFFGDEAGEKVAAHKVVYMLFLCGVLLVPTPLWRNVILLAGAVFFGVIFMANSARIRVSPALVLFVGFCGLSVFTGYGGADSLRVFVIFFACVVHGLCVLAMVRSMAEVRLFAKLVAAALVLTALFGMYQLAVGIPIRPEFTDLLASPGLTRLHSTMGNPNNDAQAWGMLLPFVLAMLVAARCDGKRLLLAGAVGIVVIAFALTYSRAGYVALMAGVGVFVLMAAPRLVPIALIGLVLALPFIPAGITDRLLTLGTDTSSQYRFNIWRGVASMLEIYWVQGIGMGPVAFARMYAQHYHAEAWRALHAHNTFLDIFIHSGIGALVSFVAYLFSLVKRGVVAHMRAADAEYKMFTAAGVGALVVFITFGVGEYVWFYPRVMLVFWVMVGMLAGVSEMKVKTVGHPPHTPQGGTSPP